ncbi:hypothetical protein D3C78_1819290 [compost metagenome]
MAILARSWRLELLFPGQVRPAVVRLSELPCAAQSGVYGLFTDADPVAALAPLASPDRHSYRYRFVLPRHLAAGD